MEIELFVSKNGDRLPEEFMETDYYNDLNATTVQIFPHTHLVFIFPKFSWYCFALTIQTALLTFTLLTFNCHFSKSS